MKRLFDITLALLIFTVLLLPMFVFMPVQLFLLGRPIFFLQPRLGRNGAKFNIIKFRSMRAGSTSDASRLTGWGQLLRSTSIDELPELWNVLRGQMSLVGPRPLPLHYLPRYSTTQARRHEIRPGITGWAQINGRNEISWQRQFELDLWYLENQSLMLDFRILLRTVGKVLRRKNISQAGRATRSEFMGNSE
jgi:lipopolysaccharide/colanic/teichoic acid biosynthesis glycosyltransferase